MLPYTIGALAAVVATCTSMREGPFTVIGRVASQPPFETEPENVDVSACATPVMVRHASVAADAPRREIRPNMGNPFRCLPFTRHKRLSRMWRYARDYAGPASTVKSAKTHLIRLAAALAATLVWVAPAGADAALTKAVPAPSSVVPSAPTQIVLTFDQAVQPAPGTDVSRGGAGSVVAGKPYVPKGKPNVIVIPLQEGLGAGPYAVRWSEA